LGVGLKVYFDTLEVSTSKRVELVNITGQVEEAVGKSGVKDGICLVFAPHATAAVIANEDERGLKEDIVKWLEENFPHDGKWRHNLVDDNASAHLASAFTSSCRVFPVKRRRARQGDLAVHFPSGNGWAEEAQGHSGSARGLARSRQIFDNRWCYSWIELRC